MSDDVPQIPMPAPVEQRPDMPPPPEGGFTRQLTPEEEKEVSIQFMGGQYGEMHKMDQAIIGSSSTLTKGKSEEVKQQITQLLQQPAKPVAPQPLPPQPQVEPLQQNLTEAQPIRVNTNTPVNESSDSFSERGQLTFNFDITEKDLLFDKINKLSSRVDSLHNKIDKVFEIINTKRPTKKKSVENKQTS